VQKHLRTRRENIDAGKTRYLRELLQIVQPRPSRWRWQPIMQAPEARAAIWPAFRPLRKTLSYVRPRQAQL